MKDHFTVSSLLDARLAEEADFVDGGHKEYKVVFNIFARTGQNRKYTVIVSRRHLISAGYGHAGDIYGDSKKAAVEYAKVVLKSRFTFRDPPENAAICRGKICRFVTLPE
jgi:hypothetical protein